MCFFNELIAQLPLDGVYDLLGEAIPGFVDALDARQSRRNLDRCPLALQRAVPPKQTADPRPPLTEEPCCCARRT
jgi:hypothetical protein